MAEMVRRFSYQGFLLTLVNLLEKHLEHFKKRGETLSLAVRSPVILYVPGFSIDQHYSSFKLGRTLAT